jgi:hypothetical protein
MSNSLRSQVQFENYLLRLRCPSYTHTTIRRIARMMELRGVQNDGLYLALRKMHPDLVDLNNPVLDEMNRRAAERAREAKENPPTLTLDEWVKSFS